MGNVLVSFPGGGAQMLPVPLGETTERDHPVPVSKQGLNRLWLGLAEAVGEPTPQTFRFGPGLRVGNLAQEFLCFRFQPAREAVHGAHKLMVPAATFLALAEDLSKGGPGCSCAIITRRGAFSRASPGRGAATRRGRPRG